MPDILTVTLNPALDVATSVDKVLAGTKLRCAEPSFDPGGGGLNVSRAILQLGGQSTTFLAIAGSTGQRIADLARAVGLTVEVQETDGETRQSFTVRDTSLGQQYRFVMPGAAWNTATCDTTLDRLAQLSRDHTFLVVSGSLPPGSPIDFLSRLRRHLRDTDVHLIADTSGQQLHQLVDNPIGLAVLRMDEREAAELLGRDAIDETSATELTTDLVSRNVADCVIVARGAAGSTLAGPDGVAHCACPVDRVASAVGAGDSFLGGFCLALSRGLSHAVALRHGTAAASAALLTPGTELCRETDAARLFETAVLSET